MKKLRNHYLSMLMIAGLGFLASCGGDEDEPEPEKNPTIEFIGGTDLTSGNRTVAAGDQITTKVTAKSGTAGTNLERFTITSSINGATPATIFDTTGLKGENFAYTSKFFTQGNAGTSVYTFTITDNKGRSSNQSYTITTTSGNTGAAINTYSTQMVFGAQNNTSAPSFFGTSNGQKYFLSGAKANSQLVDLVYFYGSTNQATIAAPNDNSFGTGAGQISSLGIQTWTKKNATTFKETLLSGTDFDAITTDAGITAAYTAGTNTTTTSRATALAAGDVIAFKTEAGKHGLIKIVNVTGTNNGTISIVVKVQK